jgi:hypothetical protein
MNAAVEWMRRSVSFYNLPATSFAGDDEKLLAQAVPSRANHGTRVPVKMARPALSPRFVPAKPVDAANGTRDARKRKSEIVRDDLVIEPISSRH